jgi:hypothetical protein
LLGARIRVEQPHQAVDARCDLAFRGGH